MDNNEPVSTILSILPHEIRDSKPNLYPGSFIIPAGTFKKPGLLTIEKSVFYVPMAFGAASLKATSSSYEVANSVVNDYVSALIEVSENCRPGIWVVNEKVKNATEASVIYVEQIQKYLAAQRNWFFSLVNAADAEYAKHHQAQSISDLQKMAARELNLKDKPWLLDISQLSINNCPACYAPVNANAILCPSCRYVIDKEKYNPANFAVRAD